MQYLEHEVREHRHRHPAEPEDLTALTAAAAAAIDALVARMPRLVDEAADRRVRLDTGGVGGPASRLNQGLEYFRQLLMNGLRNGTVVS